MTDELVEKYHGWSRWDYFRWDCSARFLQFAKEGIFLPFADSIEYENKGILFVGYSSSGKTDLAETFVNQNKGSRRLSEDCTTCLFDGENTWVYQTEYGINADLKPIVKNDSRSPLLLICYLDTNFYEEKVDLKDILRVMFSSGFADERVSQETIDSCMGAFSAVEFVHIPYTETIEERREYLKINLQKICSK